MKPPSGCGTRIRRAAGLGVPLGLLLPLAACVSENRRREPAAPPLIEAVFGLPLAAHINQRGPYGLGLDTGQSLPLLLTPPVAAALQLPVVQQASASDGNEKNAQTVDVVQVDRLAIGRAVFENVPALVMDTSANGERKSVGAAGFPLFKDLLLTLDYPANRIFVRHGTLPPADGKTILPFELVHELPVLTVRVGPLDVPALLDSGSQGQMILPLRLAKQLPLAAEPRRAGRIATLFNEVELWEAELDGSVWIGAHEIKRPRLTFADHFEEANLGRGALGEFRVTFDQRNRRVRFERSGKP